MNDKFEMIFTTAELELIATAIEDTVTRDDDDIFDKVQYQVLLDRIAPVLHAAQLARGNGMPYPYDDLS